LLSARWQAALVTQRDILQTQSLDFTLVFRVLPVILQFDRQTFYDTRQGCDFLPQFLDFCTSVLDVGFVLRFWSLICANL
jgi:hypothetical protein